MVDGIDNFKNNASVTETELAIAPSSSIKQPLEQQNEKNTAYSLAFSDEAWNILGVKDEKKDEEQKNEEKIDASGKKELTEEEERQVEKLKEADKRVRTHEQAHISASGGYARGGAQYDYVTGPDGKRYANSGHVNLDTSPEKEPEATIRKANIIRKAALAPADPSPSDRQIAAEAAQMAAKAQQELAKNSQDSQSQPLAT